jgi:fatty-acyl-CoA synthase
MDWNLGDLFDAVEPVLPADAPALLHGEQRVSWRDLSRRSNNLARALRELGARPDDKIALYLRNGPEYLEIVVAALKARLVHVNVNYRYVEAELAYILENSDARWVCFDAEFADRISGQRARCPGVVRWIQIGGSPVADALPYEKLAEAGGGAPLGIERSPDDLVFVYTGGTTGHPKAVMWRQADLWGALGAGSNAPANRGHRPADLAEHVANVRAHGPGPRQLVACPLMHGTGLFTSIGTLAGGGCIVTTPGRHFDPDELFACVDAQRVNSIVIVGDAFARPMLEALERSPGHWDLSSLKLILSSGVMWSRETKQRMLEQLPEVTLADLFGSSEALGFGQSVTSRKRGQGTARFRIGDGCKVFTEDLREVTPGSGERGFIARSGPIPLGYYKDPERSARVFRTIGGVRYSIPGDWCTVDGDGTLNLLGRGSACINSGGEKIFPEEVEEALKTHGPVRDALVFGMPDPRWNEVVTAVVEVAEPASFDEEALREHLRARLAAYKLPKRILLVPVIFRTPAGKPDYHAAQAFARSAP